MYRKCPKIILVCQKCTKKLLGVLINVVYQPVHLTSHAPKCTKCTKTHQGLCLACKNNVTSVTVPNVTGVPNVTSTPNVPKMTKIIIVCQKCAKKLLGVPNGVVYQPVYQTSHVTKCTKCTKNHQGWCLVCKNNVTSVTVPNVTGVPKVTKYQTCQKWSSTMLVCQKMCQTCTRCTNSVSRWTKRHMYQNAPNVEKRTQRDRSRCDSMHWWTKITSNPQRCHASVPTTTPITPSVLEYCSLRNLSLPNDWPVYKCQCLTKNLTAWSSKILS